eukprot:1325448-Amphidinium_carterae.1
MCPYTRSAYATVLVARRRSNYLFNYTIFAAISQDELELPLRNGQGSKSHGASISVPAGCCVQTPE